MFQNGVGLTVKKLRTLRNTALKTANANSAYSTGLIIGSIFASEIWWGGGLIFGKAKYRSFTVLQACTWPLTNFIFDLFLPFICAY